MTYSTGSTYSTKPVLLNIVCFVLEIGLNDSNIGVVWFMINITALVGLGTNHADGYF